MELNHNSMEALGSIDQCCAWISSRMRPSQANLTPHMDAATAWKHWQAWKHWDAWKHREAWKRCEAWISIAQGPQPA